MRKERSFQDYVRQAEHYLAIGQDEVYLSRDDDAPWELATGADAGGTHRLEICVSVTFYAAHGTYILDSRGSVNG